jgi:hypothetical protein
MVARINGLRMRVPQPSQGFFPIVLRISIKPLKVGKKVATLATLAHFDLVGEVRT